MLFSFGFGIVNGQLKDHHSHCCYSCYDQNFAVGCFCSCPRWWSLASCPSQLVCKTLFCACSKGWCSISWIGPDCCSEVRCHLHKGLYLDYLLDHHFNRKSLNELACLDHIDYPVKWKFIIFDQLIDRFVFERTCSNMEVWTFNFDRSFGLSSRYFGHVVAFRVLGS